MVECASCPDCAPDQRLPRPFFDRPVLQVAPDLLGRIVTHDTPSGRVAVKLTEVEAYDGSNDPGSHAYRGRSRRNATMFGPPGHLYVYFTYGMHYCMNLVCGPVGRPTGILLRGAEVIGGVECARERRPTARADRELARGPARLVRALGIGPDDDGVDVCGEGRLAVFVGRPPEPALIRTGPRVGLRGAADFPWRFWTAGEASVSDYRPHLPKRVTR